MSMPSYVRLTHSVSRKAVANLSTKYLLIILGTDVIAHVCYR